MQFALRTDTEIPRKWVSILVRLMGTSAYFLPAIPVLYLIGWQDADLRFADHDFHVLAILVATLEGLVISYVCWRCYLQSGELLVKRLTQGFLGFTVVYSLHGVFTPLADHHMMMFLLYGPVSRLLMSVLLLLAVRTRHAGAVASGERNRPVDWARFIAALMLLNVAVAVVANSSFGMLPGLRAAFEWGAAGFNLAALLMIRRGPGGRPLLNYFSHALAWFAVSSLGFIWSQPWNHLWWLAHGTFAVGFSILGYGVCKAYLSEQALGRVFGVDALFDDLEQHNAQLKEACQSLSEKNTALQSQIHDLERSQQSFRTLFATVPDGILIVEKGGKILKANAAVEQLLGYAPGALLGVRVEMLMPSGYRERHVSKRERFEFMPQSRRMGTISQPMPCLRSDGTLCYCDISIGGLVYLGEQCMVTYLREVPQLPQRPVETDAHSAPSEASRNALIADVLSLVPDMLLEIRRNADGSYVCVSRSPACAQWLDMAPALAPEKWMQLLLSRVSPADLPQVIETLEAAAFEGSRLEVRWHHQIPGRALQALHLTSAASQGDAQGNLRWLCLLRSAVPEAAP